MKSVTVQSCRFGREGAVPDLRAGKTPSQFNLLLVGAAGFEPTTCSTQNCRATRLRYTPIIWETTSIHASSAASKAPAGRFNRHCFQRALFSMGIEERMSDPVAGLDAVFFLGA